MGDVVRFPYLQGVGIIGEYKLYVRNETRSISTVRVRDHYINRLSAALDVTIASETDLETWLRGQGWSASSVNSALGAIRHFYKWAQRYGHIPANPTLGIRRLPMPRRVARIAPDATIVRAMMRAPVDTRVMLMLGAECGLRRAEIAKVHRSDIDGEWLYVVGKGGHQRFVHLSPEMLELIRMLPADGWLFPSPVGGHLKVDAIYKRIKRVSGLNPHSLRHRAGTAVYLGTGTTSESPRSSSVTRLLR